LSDLGMLIIKDEIQKNSPMLSNIKQSSVNEGNKLGILRENGEFDVSEFELFQAEITLSNDEFDNLSQEQIYDKIYMSLAQQFSEQMSKSVIEKIDEALAQTGNVVASPNGLTNEWVLEATKKMSLSFIDDDRNKPVMQTIFVSPEMAEKYRIYSHSLTDKQRESFAKSYQEVLNVKYQEFLLDLNNRQLID
jgi:hypothetical protein